MDLGNIWNITLESKDETTFIISQLHSGKTGVDTICIEGLFDVWQGKGDSTQRGRAFWGERAFNISLYIQKCHYIKPSSITFTDLKRQFNHGVYHLEEVNGIFLETVCKGLVNNLNMEIETIRDYQFDEPIQLRAQAYSDRNDGYGRASDYSIVGIKIRRWY